MPDGYGVEGGGELLDWPTVEQRLVEVVHYWLSTVRPDGRPHSIPRWGVWLDERFWYDGSPDTRHARNLRSNPSCSLHLESGSSAVILEGTSRPSDPVGPALGERLSTKFVSKYRQLGYAPGPDSWSDQIAGGLLIFRPATALAWTVFPRDLTKFAFD